MRFNTTVQLGPHREITLQGFLLCKAVGIARTGEQVYGPGQTPLEVGANGTVIITREASEVFRAETIDSGNGATFVAWFHTGKLSHPVDHEGATEFVVPDNWKEYAAGFVFNVRRGSGSDSDLLLADILVTDKEAIRLIVEEGYEEVSAGYDAEYEEDGPGRGRQTKILINHVALVESGRAGPRCAVLDSAEGSGGKMAKLALKVKGITTEVKHKLAGHIRSTFPTIDEADLQKAIDAIEEEPETEAEKKAREEAETKKTADSKRTRDAAECPECDGTGKDGDKKCEVCDGKGKVADSKTKDEADDEEKDGDTHIHVHASEGKTVDSDEFEALKSAHSELQGKHEALEARVGDQDDRLAEMEARLPAAKTADSEKEEEEEKKKVEDELKEEAPEGTGDEDLEKVAKATDSAFMEDSFQTTRSNAEILAPGVKFPAFDSSAAPRDTLDMLTTFRKKVLGIAAATTDSAAMIAELRGGRPLSPGALDRMSPKETRSLFNGAATTRKALNANRTTDASTQAADKDLDPGEKMKKAAAEFWAKNN